MKKAPSNNTAAKNEVVFLGMPLRRLVFFEIITFGLYELYWHYQNWQAVKNYKNEKMWPFWRAVFAVFWAWPLFKHILYEAKSHGYQGSYSPGWLAILYFFSTASIKGSSNNKGVDDLVVLAVYIIAFFAGLIPLYINQKAINYNNEALAHRVDTNRTTTTGERIFIVIGVLIWSTFFISFFYAN